MQFLLFWVSEDDDGVMFIHQYIEEVSRSCEVIGKPGGNAEAAPHHGSCVVVVPVQGISDVDISWDNSGFHNS